MPRSRKSSKKPPARKAKSAPKTRVKKGLTPNIRELKARQARERKELAQRQSAELKKFRKEAAILKRQGLAFQKIAVKDLKPSDYRNRVLKAFKDVIEGKAKPHKVPRKTARYFKQQGERVRNNRVVLKELPNEKTIVRHGRIITKERIGDKEQVREYHPVRIENLTSFLEGLRKDKRFKAQQKKGTVIGFEMFGYRSRATFRNIDDAIKTLMGYLEQRQFNKMSAEDQREMLKHIFFQTTRPGQWDAIQHNQSLAKSRRKESGKRARKRLGYHARLKKLAHRGGTNRTVYRVYLEKDRERKAKKRKSKKGHASYNSYMREYMRRKREE